MILSSIFFSPTLHPCTVSNTPNQPRQKAKNTKLRHQSLRYKKLHYRSVLTYWKKLMKTRAITWWSMFACSYAPLTDTHIMAKADQENVGGGIKLLLSKHVMLINHYFDNSYFYFISIFQNSFTLDYEYQETLTVLVLPHTATPQCQVFPHQVQASSNCTGSKERATGHRHIFGGFL